MPAWKAGPERPRHRFCWRCSRQLHGRVFARILDETGLEHDVHKSCLDRSFDGSVRDTVVLESSTAK